MGIGNPGAVNASTSAVETPAEVKTRKDLVKAAVRHALRCVQVQAEDRAALVVQRHWRSYAAARELRRRRWAKRRQRLGRAGVAALLAAPFVVLRGTFRAAAFALRSFLAAFWLARATLWFAACVPRALYHALVSWEGAVAAVVAAALAARDGNPLGVGFQDYFAAYVVGFVALDVCARHAVVRPAVAAGAAARRCAAAAARVALAVAAKMSPTRSVRTAVTRLATLLGHKEKRPRRCRVLHYTTPPPLVMPTPHSVALLNQHAKNADEENPSSPRELLDAVKTAEIFARESKAHAEILDEKLEAIERKLQTFAALSEAQMAAAAKETSERASSAADSTERSNRDRYALQESKVAAATVAPSDLDLALDSVETDAHSAHASLKLVDERIDKRFEDMEAMLRAARDEGRAEGVRQSAAGAEWLEGEDLADVGRHSFDRPPELFAERQAPRNSDDGSSWSAPLDTTSAIEQGLKEGMHRGIMKGIELEKMRKKQKSWKHSFKRMMGLESEKKAAQSRLDELKVAIRNKSLELPANSEQYK